jgi:hypothetical protein
VMMFFIFGNHPLQPGCQERDTHLKTFLVNVLQLNPTPDPRPATAFHAPLHRLHPMRMQCGVTVVQEPRQRRPPTPTTLRPTAPGLAEARGLAWSHARFAQDAKTPRQEDDSIRSSLLASLRLCVSTNPIWKLGTGNSP